MKRFWAVLLSVVIATACMSGTTFAAQAEEMSNEKYFADVSEAESVLGLLADVSLPDAEYVTRGEFVCATAKMLKVGGCVPAEYFFEDIGSDSAIADSVYTAAELGWISHDTSFDAERKITASEAVKILVRALNYELVAEGNGGYPTGDFYVAKRIGLTDGVNVGGEYLTRGDTYILLMNALCANTFERTVWGDSEEYTLEGDSLLYSLYDVIIKEGKISRTPYNTLSGSERDEMKNQIEIEGVQYDCEGMPYDMLGVKVRAYVRCDKQKSEKEVVYFRDISEKQTVNLSDMLGKSGQTVKYWNEYGTKEREIRLAANCSVILNGRKVTEDIGSCFERAAGCAVFVDNNSDNVYDTVFVNKYSYITVLSYDALNKSLRDANKSDFTISLDNVFSIAKDESGAEIEIGSISAGDVLRVIRSNDKKLVILEKVIDQINGEVRKIDSRTITVDNTEYEMSDYFKSIFKDKTRLASEASFTVDGNMVVSSADGDAGTQYGYLVAAGKDGVLETKVTVRVYTQKGTFEERNLSKKLRLDGVSGKTAEEALTFLSSGGHFVPQFVRYSLNGDGELNIIDTATETLPETPGEYPDAYNRLTKYSYMSGDMTYKSSISSLSTFCNVENSVIFCIPNDLSQRELFAVQGKAHLLNSKKYNLSVYDLDELGAAGALVYSGDNSYLLHAEFPAMVISEVVNAIDDDGEEIYEIYGWYNGQFATMKLDRDFAVTKTSETGKTVDSAHPILSGGDIIRFSADSTNKIRTMEVVFDARQGVFAANVSDFNTDSDKAPQFWAGMIYTSGNKFASLSYTKSADGYDFFPEKLRYISTNTSNIVRYNARTGDVRPMTADEIKGFKTDGENAHYGVFCQSSFITKTIVLYEETEARE